MKHACIGQVFVKTEQGAENVLKKGIGKSEWMRAGIRLTRALVLCPGVGLPGQPEALLNLNFGLMAGGDAPRTAMTDSRAPETQTPRWTLPAAGRADGEQSPADARVENDSRKR